MRSKLIHTKSEKMKQQSVQLVDAGVSKPEGESRIAGQVVVGSKASISLSMSPEIAKLCEELAKVTVISLVDVFVNKSSIIEATPSIINHSLAGLITSLNDCTFLVPLANREEVKEVCKAGTSRAMTKDGPCTLKFSLWSSF